MLGEHKHVKKHFYIFLLASTQYTRLFIMNSMSVICETIFNHFSPAGGEIKYNDYEN